MVLSLPVNVALTNEKLGVGLNNWCLGHGAGAAAAGRNCKTNDYIMVMNWYCVYCKMVVVVVVSVNNMWMLTAVGNVTECFRGRLVLSLTPSRGHT